MSKVNLESSSEKQQPMESVVVEKDRIITKARIHRLTFIVSISLAGFVCYLSALRYFSWMVQTVIDRTDVHISEIPFPAVTLCPLMAIHTAVLNIQKSDELMVRKFLQKLDNSIDHNDRAFEFNSQARMALEYVFEEDILSTVTFRCEDFFAECTWRRVKRNCCDMFRPKRYGHTLCYAFNSLTVDDPDPSWPWSETLSGPNSGLSVTMTTNASRAMISKVLAMIHYPEEPYSNDKTYLEGEVHISMDASKFYADTALRKVSPECRRCYFLDEIHQKMRSTCACLKDCRVAYLQKVCNCVPHNPFRHRKPNSNKVYCNVTHLQCIYEHRDAFYSTGNIYERKLTEESTEVMDCKCYPNCNYIQYKPFVRHVVDSGCCNKTRDKNLVNLNVSYLRDMIFSYRSAMVYGLLDLMVAICSIIALFLGVSFISVVKAIQDHFERRRLAREAARVTPNQ